MAFQASKPDLFLAKAIAQEDILGNFQAYQTAWQYDHTVLDAANNGWHNKTSLTINDEITSIPANDIALYATSNANAPHTGYLAVKRGDPAQEYVVRSYITPDNLNTAYRTFSGLMIKSYIRKSINTNGGTVVLTIAQQQQTNIPVFTEIYGIFPTVLNDQNGTDSNADVLVTGWSVTPNSETINLRIWRRNLNGTAGTDRPPVLVNFLLIGKG